jgi:hypothetical protein
VNGAETLTQALVIASDMSEAARVTKKCREEEGSEKEGLCQTLAGWERRV